jgi:hypothetical protein
VLEIKPREKRGMGVQSGTNAVPLVSKQVACTVTTVLQQATHTTAELAWKTSSYHKPLLLRGMTRFLLQRGVPLRDVTTIDTLLRSRDLALLGLSPIVSRAHRARQEQGPLEARRNRGQC